MRYWLEKIAGWKYRVIRLQWYFGLISLYLVGRLYFDSHNVKWWHILVIPAFYLLNWFDKNYGVSKEQETATSSNPEHQKLVIMVERLEEKIDKIQKV
jgi:hypothetical protein